MGAAAAPGGRKRAREAVRTGLAGEGRGEPEGSRGAGTGVRGRRGAGQGRALRCPRGAGGSAVVAATAEASGTERRVFPRIWRSPRAGRGGLAAGAPDLLTRATRRVVALAGVRGARLERGPPAAAVEREQFCRT